MTGSGEQEELMLFFKCNMCGNFVVFLGKKSGCTPECCGSEMEEVKANTTDAAQEKHVPDVTVDGQTVKVQVGSTMHPALEEHHIDFIILETDKGFQKRDIVPGDEPVAEFVLADGEKAVAVYEHCNLHGLWKKEL